MVGRVPPPPAAVALTESALDRYMLEPGRSAAISLSADGVAYRTSRAADTQVAAASLMKVPLALACEAAWRHGAPEAVSVGRLRGGISGPSVLRLLSADLVLDPHDVLGLAVGLSDNACARWMLATIGAQAVSDALREAGCASSRAWADATCPDGLAGLTTAADAVRAVEWLLREQASYPATAAALCHSGRNSRIPLGVTASDVALAHKTGTLTGLAHDVAWLDCDRGWMICAFLTDSQHDTLVSGYEMGICTRSVLQAWALRVRRTRALQ